MAKAPHIKVSVVDKLDGQVVHIETDVVTLLDHPEFEDERFHGLMSAIEAYLAKYPGYKSFTVEFVDNK